MQTVTPYLLYEDAAAATEFLQRAFGFEEITRMEAPDGRVNHAELRLGGGELHLGQPEEPVSPQRLGGTPVGSVSVVRQLLAARLLDELQLFLHPIAAGKGKRLFEEGEPPIPLQLFSSEAFKTGVLYFVYAPAEAPDGAGYESAKAHLEAERSG